MGEAPGAQRPGGVVRTAVKRLPSITATGLVAVLAVACSSSASSGPGAQLAKLETSNLTVAAVPLTDDAGLYIAKDLGLFKAAGLNVTIDPVVSSATVTQGQNDGQYDITVGNAVSYVQAEASGASNLEIVAEGSLMQPGNQALYVLSNSPIETVSQLAGQRIGVNAPNNIGTLLISALLNAHGMAPSTVQFVPLAGGFPAMATALVKHQIDVAWLPEPWGSIDSATIGLRELADLDQGETTAFPIAWYVATKGWAQKNPDTLTAFLDALRQGQELADTDRADVERAMEEFPAPYTVSANYAAIMSVANYPLDVTPDIDEARVQRVVDAMQQFSMVSSTFNVGTMLAR
jgi:NitT/TauT family transport system substrate-binding protein